MAATATLRCYAELNDFLPRRQRQLDLSIRFEPPVPVRHLIANAGIPPAAVELVLLNGVSVAFDTRVADGDRVSIYPVFESFDVSGLLRVRGSPLRQVRFVADAHLGRLARYLRMLGFDTLFDNDIGDREMARLSREEGRILLTRDRGLLMRRGITHACFLPQLPPREQLRWVVERLQLAGLFKPFSRCTTCNGDLATVTVGDVAGSVPDGVLRRNERFWRCLGCGRVYWQGSHYARMQEFVARVLGGECGILAHE